MKVIWVCILPQLSLTSTRMKLFLICVVWAFSEGLPARPNYQRGITIDENIPHISGESIGKHYLVNELEHGNQNGAGVIHREVFDQDSNLYQLFKSMQPYDHDRLQEPDSGKEVRASLKAQNHDHHHTKDVPSGEALKRNFDNQATLWNQGTIPYVIDSSIYQQSMLNAISGAIQQFQSFTCIRLVERTTESDYINFVDDRQGCWSYVGKINGQQRIGLMQGTQNGCDQVTTVLHEIMHAMGMHHEQSRTDRDGYIKILWDNAIPGQSSNTNLGKENTNTKYSYDAESVLQYGLKAFSKNGQPTMELLDSNLNFLPGSTQGLTFYDIADIADKYRSTCADQCQGASRPVCENGGFVNWDCKCFCPFETTSPVCGSVVTDQGCGGVINLNSGEEKEIKSLNYPSNYDAGKLCVWLIKGPAGSNIKVTIEDLELPKDGSRCDHWLEVRYNIPGQTGGRKCGTLSDRSWETPNEPTSNLVLLKFDSKFAGTVPAQKGFLVKVKAIGGATTQSTSTTSSGASTSTTTPASTSTTSSGASVSTTTPASTSPTTSSGSSVSTTTTSSTTTTPDASGLYFCSFEPQEDCMIYLYNIVEVEQQTSVDAISGSYYLQAQSGYFYISIYELTVPSGDYHCVSFALYVSGYGQGNLWMLTASQTYLQLTEKDIDGSSWTEIQATLKPGEQPGWIDVISDSTLSIYIDMLRIQQGSCT